MPKLILGMDPCHKDSHDNQLDAWVFTLANEKARMTEERIALVLQPAPRFFPKWLWLKLASYFVRMETMV